MEVNDRLARPLGSLRLSVTDRCNLRCGYCMPEEVYTWLPRSDLLSFEETARLAELFTRCGVDKIRLTGGEPLLRKDLETLIAMLARLPAVKDLALTTNGLLLADQAASLAAAGLRRITVSLDTLQPKRFVQLSRRDQLPAVLKGIRAAKETGLDGLKIDSVIIRGTNDDELVDLIEFGKEMNAEVRFIEYMDVGGATQWSMERVVPSEEMRSVLEDHYGTIQRIDRESWAPARRYALPDGTTFGIVASTTEPFCRTCDRSRVTADGLWYLCLYAQKGVDLRAPLREGASDEQMLERMRATWSGRTDRGAEQRLQLSSREALAQDVLREDPHLEMHTRGG